MNSLCPLSIVYQPIEHITVRTPGLDGASVEKPAVFPGKFIDICFSAVLLSLRNGAQGKTMAGEKILNIDDSPTVQRLIEMILSSQGYQVVLASDGEEGIAKAKSERPALILVDFVMPKMNGYQVCKTLKDDPEFRDTPIILVTSKGDKVGSKFVDVLGISEYFTKPFQPEELLSKIREVLDKKAEEEAAAKAAAAKSRSTPATAPRARRGGIVTRRTRGHGRSDRETHPR